MRINIYQKKYAPKKHRPDPTIKNVHRNSLKSLKFQNNLICFQHDGCKWSLIFHIQHQKTKKNNNWPIINNHNKMTHS
jgi:hypothetical protein